MLANDAAALIPKHGQPECDANTTFPFRGVPIAILESALHVRPKLIAMSSRVKGDESRVEPESTVAISRRRSHVV
jgi:hypothetical protein